MIIFLKVGLIYTIAALLVEFGNGFISGLTGFNTDISLGGVALTMVLFHILEKNNDKR